MALSCARPWRGNLQWQLPPVLLRPAVEAWGETSAAAGSAVLEVGALEARCCFALGKIIDGELSVDICCWKVAASYMLELFIGIV
jgi:hypothetical protein